MPIFLAPVPQHPHKAVSPFPGGLFLDRPVAFQAFAPVKGKPKKIEGPLWFPAPWWLAEWNQLGLIRVKGNWDGQSNLRITTTMDMRRYLEKKKASAVINLSLSLDS